MATKQRLPITEFMKKAYLEYFEVKLGDQDKKWAPHKVCGAYIATLRKWSKGQKCHIKFEVPMVWRDPKNHHADCYFCMVNTKGFNFKRKHAASYPDIPSGRIPVEHCAKVPIPAFSGLPSLQSEDYSSSLDEDGYRS